MRIFFALIAIVLLVLPLVGCNTGVGNPSRSGVADPGVAPVSGGYAPAAPAPAPAPS